MAGQDSFMEFLAELSDGQRWKLLRAEGWEDFIERLTTLIVDLPVRRRQALVMLLFALSEGLIDSEDARIWTEGHDLESDEDVEEMISWLRQYRPRGD